jgi:hypothetical protein
VPGTFAHITVVNLARESRRIDELGISKHGAAALNDWFGFTEMGCVSPDYPYLAERNREAAMRWADLMHYTRTGDMVRSGVGAVRELSGESKRRAFAWLLGYSAHVATDVTIHPIVELKVGKYSENKTAHRECEMHQDAYIWPMRMNLGEVGVCEHLSNGILRCIDSETKQIHSDVKSVWSQMLDGNYPAEAQRNLPNIDSWHRGFDLLVNKIGEEGGHLMPLARHVAVDCGLTYPAFDEIDRVAFINALRVPTGGVMHYDQILDRAVENVGKAWRALDAAINDNNSRAVDFFGNWNLDTGRDANGNLAFWS